MDYIHLDITESTNSHAKRLAADGCRDTTLIVADRQTAGRGRLGRSFCSPTGGLYMSLLFFPQGSAEQVSLFTPLMALAVCAAVRELCAVEADIKWVNDIYLKGKKLCGILAEAEPTERGVKYAVVGVGLNITAPKGGFPQEIKDTATALFDSEADTAVDKEQLAFRIAELFLQYTESDRTTLLDEYRKRLMYVGKKVSVSRFGDTYTATVLGIDGEFGLSILTDDGEMRVLHSGEISIRPTEDNI